MTTIRYTGKRTHRPVMATSYGELKPGDTVEVSDTVAEAWTRQHSMGRGKTGSDFELVAAAGPAGPAKQEPPVAPVVEPPPAVVEDPPKVADEEPPAESGGEEVS